MTKKDKNIFETDLKNMTLEEIKKKYGAFEENAVSLEDIEEEEKIEKEVE